MSSIPVFRKAASDKKQHLQKTSWTSRNFYNSTVRSEKSGSVFFLTLISRLVFPYLGGEKLEISPGDYEKRIGISPQKHVQHHRIYWDNDQATCFNLGFLIFTIYFWDFET